MEVQLKSAREMFEELGYEVISKPNTITYRLNKGYFYYICFKLNKKTVYKSKGICGKEVASSITTNELQAINKQVEELGWNK